MKAIAIVLRVNDTTEVFYPDWSDEEFDKFIEQNETSGCSVAGTTEQVIDELRGTMKSWDFAWDSMNNN